MIKVKQKLRIFPAVTFGWRGARRLSGAWFAGAERTLLHHLAIDKVNQTTTDGRDFHYSPNIKTVKKTSTTATQGRTAAPPIAAPATPTPAFPSQTPVMYLPQSYHSPSRQFSRIAALGR
ncbi:hypothetical protein [Serratia odorifera]|uniref:hypothetical protein n=1 Tax=Serratia odorifera TaxID=618 RepID=UPI0018E81E24|nr:hypothetical protein [Serratia odorifera]MBJ2065248.1 hypothetical protein [Serratia odorifera]